MKIFWNEESHLKDFITLNNAWIEKNFGLEENNQNPANDPAKILRDGGYVLTVLIKIGEPC